MLPNQNCTIKNVSCATIQGSGHNHIVFWNFTSAGFSAINLLTNSHSMRRCHPFFRVALCLALQLYESLYT